MYNKISPIILNTGKANGASDVFVSQPDALKEGLAGKIFILAEIEGKKSDSHKIIDFLISSLEDYYYNDEKIILRDKIEGLKIENIFEAALAKTNRALADFLNQEKIILNPQATNITLGVVFENRLHFSSYGNNRALLIYSHQSGYEIVNIEANTTDLVPEQTNKNYDRVKTPKLFSSVVSGEVPENSYFIFISEALSEYLSDKKLVDIITKLPPIVASEQIKNILAKINSHVPFLGIIIKNTFGSAISDSPERLDTLSAQNSISALNHTEQRTEKMLSPVGLIDLRKIIKRSGKFLGKLSAKREATIEKPNKVDNKKEALTNLSVNSLNHDSKNLNLPRKESFLIKDKIFFRKQSGWLWLKLKRFFTNIPKVVNNLSLLLKNSRKKNRFLFTSLIVVVVIFSLSILVTNINHRQQIAKQNFDNLVTKIKEKESLVSSHLLYNDEDGAKTVLSDAQLLLNKLPKKKNSQKETYNLLYQKLQSQEEKVQKIVKISKVSLVANLDGLNAKTIVWANKQLYAASANYLYKINANNQEKMKLDGANLIRPYFVGRDQIYYWDNNKIVQFNFKNQKVNILNVPDLKEGDEITSYRIFNKNLYLLLADKNQIYKYTHLRTNNGFNKKSDWLRKKIDLSRATDLAIDGDIYILNNDASVLDLYKGQKRDYNVGAIMPLTNDASKLIVGDKYLYIFIPDSKRVVVLAKQDGHLMNQYQIDTSNNFKDLAVDEANKTAYLLGNKAIYKIKLNQ